MLAKVSEVGARHDSGDDDMVQASFFKAEETGECGDVLSRMGDGELAWQVEDKACIYDGGETTDMTPSPDCTTNYRQ